jgi:hypothetical protein
MNGTIYDEIKKKTVSKKREKLKLVASLISTNTLVAIICLSQGHPANTLTSPEIPRKILHPHYKMVILPLTLFIEAPQNAAETPITLMTKSKKILIAKAFLHEAVQKGPHELEGPSQFKIEIPESEVLKLSAEGSSELIALPELNLPPKGKSTTNKRVSHYEISL